MTKLASTLAASADPHLLELRILANHGLDARFAFLRNGGKWSQLWAEIRAPKPGARTEDAGVAGVNRGGGGGGGLGLVAYGSDSEEEEEEEGEERDGSAEEVQVEAAEGAEAAVLPIAEVGAVPSGAGAGVGLDGTEEGEEERARREVKAEKARAWAAKRKQAREAADPRFTLER